MPPGGLTPKRRAQLWLRQRLYRSGYKITRLNCDEPSEITDPAIADLHYRLAPYSLTPPNRLSALVEAVKHIERVGISGAIVECGVYRGGSMMAVAITLQELSRERELYLFDTYEGMSEPTADDVDLFGRQMSVDWTPDNPGAVAPMKDVERAMASTGYDMGRVHLVKGKVEDTVPGLSPERIALLRLDTDWYESTRHELHHLYPRLQPGGVMIIDDYGHFAGARKATDEFFASSPVYLVPLDYTARAVVKPH